MKTLAFLITLIFISTACQFIPEDKVDTRKVRKFPMEVPLPVSLSMELNTTEIARGDSLEITLTFQNYSDSTVDVVFGWDTHYGYHFDFMVTSLDTMLVWHRMAEITFQGGEEFSFGPGDNVEYPGKWGTNYDESIHQVFKGPYLIWGELDGIFGADSIGRLSSGISTEAQLIHVK